MFFVFLFVFKRFFCVFFGPFLSVVGVFWDLLWFFCVFMDPGLGSCLKSGCCFSGVFFFNGPFYLAPFGDAFFLLFHWVVLSFLLVYSNFWGKTRCLNSGLCELLEIFIPLRGLVDGFG